LHVYSVFCRQKFIIFPINACELPKDVLNVIGLSAAAGNAFKFRSYIFVPKSVETNSNFEFISPDFNGKNSKLNSPF
jgi:hypothetical protein